ncbi:MAG: hypothetical protein ACHQ49_09265 [Elusimicrobiota bacterium]
MRHSSSSPLPQGGRTQSPPGRAVIGALAAVFLAAPSLVRADYPDFYIPSFASPHAAALAPWPWTFEIGGGPMPILGRASRQLTDGSSFVFGGGYNFSPRTGFVIEFLDTGANMTGANLAGNGNQNGPAQSGDAVLWGLTVDPIWRFRVDGPVGGYLTGGGGYYERDQRFDQTVNFTFVNHLGQSVTVPGSETVHQYDGTGGLNVGGGLTWNMIRGTKLFVDVRYHVMFTSGNPTQILPINIGLRW